MAKKIIQKSLNRVEGDLELKIEVEGNIITDSWVIGTMYRGFEQILKGRDPMDSLVITPRICGICGTAHLYSAVTALEKILQCKIGINGIRTRNICLMSEEIQSDIRHALLMFTVDFCNSYHKENKHYNEALVAFEPMKGKYYIEAIQNTKKILEIVAMIGGQWPHSSYMVPGGVTFSPNEKIFITALSIIDSFIRWAEESIYGCSLERWLAVKSLADLQAWINEKKSHKTSAVGLFIRMGRSIGLHKLGKGSGNLLSYGNYFDPLTWHPPFTSNNRYRPAGFYNKETKSIEPFDEQYILEHSAYSWYADTGKGLHPFKGETIPEYNTDSKKYSWAKAPRYKDQVTEVGALAELVMSSDPLITDLFQNEGSNAWSRQFARFHRPAVSLLKLREEIKQVLSDFNESFYFKPGELVDGDGYGLIHAARGSLGHWLKVRNGKISQYQIITPTAWNASPRDSNGIRGHWEESFIGTELKDPENPMELNHIVRSHDACLVCTVHFHETGKRITYGI